MCGVEGFGDLNTELEHLFERQRLVLHATAQVLAVNEFHGDECPAVLLADVIEGANTWMIEGGGGASFAAKALERLRVACQVIGQEFQCDRAIQARVERFVDHSHSAGAEFFGDVKVGDSLVNHGRTRQSRLAPDVMLHPRARCENRPDSKASQAGAACENQGLMPELFSGLQPRPLWC